MKPSRTELGIFVVRNLLLYFLFFHAYLHFRRELDLIFLSAGFVLAVLLALWMERLRLRLWLSLICFFLLALGLRLLFFLMFRLQAAISPGPHTDFLYFYFDKSFLPGLLPWSVVWLLNFLSLRHPRFVYLEAGLDALLLLAVFWSQGHYQITLYSHPSFLSYGLFVFLIMTILLLVLARTRDRESRFGAGRLGGGWSVRLGTLASFLWVLLPLLVILLFFLLGRYNQGAVRLGGGLMKPTLFRFDFSQYVKLESEIEMSDDLVMLFRKQGPAERILLRRYILSGYDRRRGFFHLPPGKSGIEELPVTVPDSPENLPDPGYLARHEVSQEYYFVNFDPTSLIGMNYPVRVAPLTNWDDSSFLRIYRVTSRVSSAGAKELSRPGSRTLSPEELERYTDYGNQQRIRELAEQVVGDQDGGQADTLQQVLRIHDYLKYNYYYSLKPGLAADGDQLSHFLYSSKKGYCSYFAFAMALLCRSLGIPARVAVGFFVDPQAEILNFYEVRAYQAHAWVEVYFGDYGWIEFDPSSQTIAPGEEYTIQFGFDPQTFASLLAEILRNQHRLREQEPESLTVEERVRLLGLELVRGLKFVARLWYILVPALYLLVLTAVKSFPLLAAVLATRRRRRIKQLFSMTMVRLSGLGLVRSGEESMLEYAARLEGRFALTLSPWVQSYLQAVFGDAFLEEEYREALETRRAFLASWRRAFSLPMRLLGFLNPLIPTGRRL